MRKLAPTDQSLDTAAPIITGMAPLKTKGDLAELLVAADLVKRGYRVAFPFGEDSDFDLIFWRPPDLTLERVQAKYDV